MVSAHQANPPRVAVIGAGIMGLATTYELVKAGAAVRCFEFATPMMARSVGDTRIFRLAHPTPECVGFAVRSRELWRKWEHESGQCFIGTEGTVVSGASAPEWYRAMQHVGIRAELVDSPGQLGLPARHYDGPFLFDPAGGVIQARKTGKFLLDRVSPRVAAGMVFGIELLTSSVLVRYYPTEHGSVGELGVWECDQVVITAGAATTPLAAEVGLYTPSLLEHHARFTFRLADPAATPPCWLADTDWRGGFHSYSHLSHTNGYWAVGGQLRGADVSWERGPDNVAQLSRAIALDYVREYLHGVIPQVVGVVQCTTNPLGDSFGAVRNEHVIALWGGNLFKLSPLLGRMLAEAALTGDELGVERGPSD